MTSPSARADSRKRRASSLDQGTTLRLRCFGIVTISATLRATNSSRIALVRADLRTARTSLIVRADGTPLQHLPTAQHRALPLSDRLASLPWAQHWHCVGSRLS